MYRWIKHGTIGLILALTAGHAQAGQRGPGFGDGPQAMAGGGMIAARGMNRMIRRIEALAEELEVSDEQLDEIFEIIDSNRSDLRDLMRSGRETRKQLRDAQDPDQIATLAEHAGDILTQVIIHNNAIRGQVLAVLSDDQRAELEAIKADRRSRFEQRRRGG